MHFTFFNKLLTPMSFPMYYYVLIYLVTRIDIDPIGCSIWSFLLLEKHFSCLCVLLLGILKRGNFKCTESSVGVEMQLSNLATVTQVIDPKLHKHLGMHFSKSFRVFFFIVLKIFLLRRGE